MAGNTTGGLKTATKLLEKNPNHYKEIGAKGGSIGRGGGFTGRPDLAKLAGAKGGRISKRGKKLPLD